MNEQNQAQSHQQNDTSISRINGSISDNKHLSVDDVSSAKDYLIVNSDLHGSSTIMSCGDTLESSLNMDHLNSELPSEPQPPLEPYEGMEFASIEDAKIHYTRYAKSKGFSFRMGRITKSRTNGMIIGQEIICSKEGFRAKKYVEREHKRLATCDETRVGCKAMIYIKKNDDRWTIARFVRDHNHELASPRSLLFLRVHRKKTKVQKKLVDVLDASGLRPSKIASVLCTESGGVENVGFSQQSILFGCALLWDETEESFVWLLTTWLEAMSGVCPRTIITDQDAAITNAVARVFPEVSHHYCIWHIEKKVPEYLSYVYHEHSEFKSEFSKCIHQSISVEEFESNGKQ